MRDFFFSLFVRPTFPFYVTGPTSRMIGRNSDTRIIKRLIRYKSEFSSLFITYLLCSWSYLVLFSKKIKFHEIWLVLHTFVVHCQVRIYTQSYVQKIRCPPPLLIFFLDFIKYIINMEQFTISIYKHGTILVALCISSLQEFINCRHFVSARQNVRWLSIFPATRDVLVKREKD